MKLKKNCHNKSKFIVLEGIEGSGKTEMSRYLKKILKKKNIKKIISVRQPGSTIISEKLRSILKTEVKNEKIYNKTEILLFYASRIQLLKNKIFPYLKKGYWVISDRHNLSTIAYQTVYKKNNKKIIKILSNILIKNMDPDLTIYFDTLPIIGLNRISTRKNIDRIEKRSINFFLKVRKNYIKEIKKISKKIIINASLDKEYVKKTLKKKIIFWLKKNEK
ncbi:dTMP kinase [Buchnera aphidicola (Pseudoregma panicola)]|uniref:dTMP kinase n=1 Tax=Buchnera aphidicola TaxID=9 RepID=UPI0031B737E0